MRRDPLPPDGDDDPLDAALGELHDLAELEQRFALLDAAASSSRTAPRADAELDDDDPFSDIARALREQRAMLDSDDDADEDSALATEDDLQLELELDDEDSSDRDDDPVAAEIEDRCQDALDALEAGDLGLAREIAMAAVRMDDEHPFPMFVLGLVAEQDGDLDTARDMAELSLRTAGTNPDAIGLRAHIHVRQHQLAEAEELLRFGIAHNPDEATLHEGLARVALARGEHREALQAASTALRIEPGNAGAIAVRAAALDEGGDRTALLAALRQGVQLHPEDPYSMLELASVEMEHGNLDRARALLLRAQRLAPRDREIGDVRALVEHVQARPLLRPVPGLLRWLRDFPGGLAGFLIGFVVAALPLHALAVTNPDYRIAALTIIVAWGGVALYAWIAPAVLTHRLNQRAARGGFDRLAVDLRDPLVPPPSAERIADVVAMLVAARARGRAVQLLELAARRTVEHDAASEVAAPLAVLARRLRRPLARAREVVLVLPAASRWCVALAVAAAVAAPALAPATALSLLAWHGVALACMTAAWLLVLSERAASRDVEDAFAAIALTSAATSTPPAGPPRRRASDASDDAA
ncbi:MAG: sulfotransferase [Thermoleophilia bacterium]|nr:sulfotransferase [Thermoleophilia bacterium]